MSTVENFTHTFNLILVKRKFFYFSLTRAFFISNKLLFYPKPCFWRLCRKAKFKIKE